MENVESNWLYLNDRNDEVRYLLGETGEKIIACIGVNPSTARPNALDPTLKSVKRIAQHNGFDGWLMYNLYPQRATDPKDLHVEVNHEDKRFNNYTIVKTIENLKIDTIWIAWGDLIDTRSYLYYCLVDLYEALKDHNLKWKIIDVPTKSGHPRHPLYKNSKSLLVDFEMENYINHIVKPKSPKFGKTFLDGIEFK